MQSRMGWLALFMLLLVSCSDSENTVTPGDADSGDGDIADGDLDAESEEAAAVVYDWPDCSEVTGGSSLAEKAAYFDLVAREQHLADDNLFRNLRLSENLQQVEAWYHVENVILWSGMYLGSQALRYAVTHETEALENARRVVDGLHELTLVTGKSGLYGRSLNDPSVSYTHSFDPAEHSGWSHSPAAGYEGFTFRNDVSKDGYAGLIFGYALALEHFDDETLLSDVRQRLREIADHIVSNGLQIIDISGFVTEHGRLFHSALDDWPGFNALLASSWIKIAETELDDAELEDFYYGCLMGMREKDDCPEIEDKLGIAAFELSTYIDSMEKHLYLFQANCKENYDNFDMCYQAIYPLLRREKDPELKERLLWVLRNNMFHTEDPTYRSLAPYGNSFFTFAYAGLTGDDPATDTMLYDAVNKAICTMKEFPERKYERAISASTQAVQCESRLSHPRAAEPLPLAEYPFDNYLWRLDFYEMVEEDIQENQRKVYSPEDYLIAYWLGRYHGILDESL